MDAREAKMEADIGHLFDMADGRIAQRDTRRDRLATKAFFVKTFLCGCGVLLAMMTFMTLYQGKLQQLFGLATIVAT